MKIGVISDGVDSRAAAQASGDLPLSIEIDIDRPGNGDEGTAMLEIIHDIAPNASLAFSGFHISGEFTSLDMVNAINYLAGTAPGTAFGGTGADIIVDDLGFFGEPFFEDGPVAEAVRDVILGGTIYVSAAGNSGGNHYEGEFVNLGGDLDGLHDFGSGDEAMTVTIGAFGVIRVDLQWNDQFGASGNDYDMAVCDTDIHICDVSDEIQAGAEDPVETAFFVNSSASPINVLVFVDRFSGATRRLEIFIYSLVGTALVIEHNVSAGSVNGHAAVPGAIAVGAINEGDPGNDDIAFYSSRGPADVYFPSFQSRAKPDLAAIDGVSVTGAGGFSNPFFGTSAAAPHIAGIAALLLQAVGIEQPGISKLDAATRVFDILQNTAIDLGSDGFDTSYGAGWVDALAAVQTTGVSLEPLTVDSTGDEEDDDLADLICDDGSGNCTLRAAIQQANFNAGTDIIEFNIDGPGPHTISASSTLPFISDPVIIDGYTQPGAAPNTNGPGLGLNTVLMIELDGSNAGSASGLTITAGASTVRGLVINRFESCGICIEGDGNLLQGNFIGTDVTGTFPLPNTLIGIDIFDAHNNVIGGTEGVTNGGPCSGACNLISGNNDDAVHIREGSGNVIQGNFIGTDVTGVEALGNGDDGIQLAEASENVIGGTTPEARNIISGNSGNGIAISDESEANLIQGNYIGTDVTGTVAISNESHGVSIDDAPKNAIGGSAGGEGNVIAFNGQAGVNVLSGDDNAILGNSIFSNVGLGIELSNEGVTPNDLGDGDTGPNGLQNFPVLAFALNSGANINIVGNLNSTNSTTFRLEFFSNTVCDASGNGEGEAFIGSADVTTDGNGDASIALSFADSVSLGHFVTATATDPNGNTSEFSTCAEVTAPDLSITKVGSPDPVAVGETLTYSLQVENIGTATSTAVVLTDTLPTSLAFVSLAPEGICEESGGTVTCGFGVMAPGAMATSTITALVLPTSDSTIENTASVTGNEPDADLSNNSATEITTIKPVDLSVTKVGSPGSVSEGDTLIYSLLVGNVGTATSTAVTLTDTLPTSLNIISFAPDGICNVSGATVTCNFGIMGPGEVATSTITAIVQATSISTITNTATVASNEPDSDPTNNESTVNTQNDQNDDDDDDGGGARRTDLMIEKTASAESVTVGQFLTYSVEIKNIGPATSTVVTLTDTLPSQVDFVSISPSANCRESDRTVTCDFGVLAVGESATSTTIIVIARQSGNITNEAKVEGDLPDNVPSNNTSSVNTTIEAADDDDDGGGGGGGGGGGARPVIAFTPEGLTFGAVEGGENPEPQILRVSTSKNRSVLRFTISGDVPWLRATPIEGISDATNDREKITVSVDISGLDVGTYTGEITITARRASNDPQTVPVTLVISSAPEPEETSPGRAPVSKSEATEIFSPDNLVRVSIPQGALPEDEDGAIGVEVRSVPVASAPAQPDEFIIVRVIELNTIVDGEIRHFEYEEPVKVTFVLTQSDLDLADGDTSRLRVLRYDDETSGWEQIPVVYEADPPPAGQLIAKLSHFSTYAVAVVAEPAAPQFSVPSEVSLVETRAVEPTATPSPTAVPVATSTPVPATPTAVGVAQARPTPQPTATPRPTATALPPAPEVPAAPAPPSQPPTQPETPPLVEESGGIGTTTLVILIVVGIAVLAGVGVVGQGLWSRRQQA